MLAWILKGAGSCKPAGQEPQRDGLAQGFRRAPRIVQPGEVIVFARAILGTRQRDRFPGGQSFFLMSKLADVVQNPVQALAGDVLHRVINRRRRARHSRRR